MHKITIRDFGPVTDCELELKSFIVLIGEQATGKSTISKCIYFCKSIRDRVKSHLYDVLTGGLPDKHSLIKKLRSEMKKRFVDLFGITKFKDNFYIKYEYGPGLHLEITLTQDKDKSINLDFCSTLLHRIIQMEQQAIEYYEKKINVSSNWTEEFFDLEQGRLYKQFDQEVNELFHDHMEHYYIPAGRGLLSLLANQLLNLEQAGLDYVTREFLKLILKERSYFEQGLTGISSSSPMRDKLKSLKIDQQISTILRGYYSNRSGREFIRPKTERNALPINYASSGQQEIVWILNLLCLWMYTSRQVFVVIEEPEAHLYPIAQRQVIDFVALFTNITGSHVMITTHSPYVLTSANNLLYAGKVGARFEREVNQYIKKEYWLQQVAFHAYKLNSATEPYLQTIMDEELLEIAAEHLDEVSIEIREVYQDILNVEAEHGFLN